MTKASVVSAGCQLASTVGLGHMSGVPHRAIEFHDSTGWILFLIWRI